MTTQPDGEWLTCSCCGEGLKNTPEQNADYDQQDLHDTGRGMCIACGGDKKAAKIKKGDDLATIEKKARKRLGWASCVFYDARIPQIEARLNETNAAKWRTLSYPAKVAFIQKMVEEGEMI